MASEDIRPKADKVASVAAKVDEPVHEGSQLLQGKIPSDDSKSLGHPIHPATVHWPIAVSPRLHPTALSSHYTIPCFSPYLLPLRLVLPYPPAFGSRIPRTLIPSSPRLSGPRITLIPVPIHHILSYSPNIPPCSVLPHSPLTCSILNASHSTLHGSSSRRHCHSSNHNGLRGRI